ncbi:MAG: hypothetical protein AAF573_01135 [Bacteroidota bacterium]
MEKIVTIATLKDGAIHGVAFVDYPNGSYFHGQYNNNIREGVGVYKKKNGNYYIGLWKNGTRHGQGLIMNDKNQIVAAGIFANGKLVTPQHEAYLSDKSNKACKGNCYDGFGAYTHDNGDKYWGFFKNGKRSFVGIYTWKNGSSYRGGYTEDGIRNGFGIYTYQDDSLYRGIFVNDAIDGLGLMRYIKSGNVRWGVFDPKGRKVRDY